MKKTNLAALLLTVVTVFMACKKNNDLPAAGSIRSAKEFVQKKGPQLQAFSVNTASLPVTITLKGGTKITIPQNAFTKAGSPVSGTITFVAREYKKRSDVLYGGSNTNHTSGAPLETQGSLFIDALQNGTSLDQQLAVPIRIEVPAENNGDVTQLWEGKVDAGAPAMGWAAPRPNPNGAGGQLESVSQNNMFAFNFGQLGWINCDVFYSYANPKTTMTVDVLNNPGTMASFMAYSGETFVFFCPDNANVAAQLYTPDGPSRVKSYDNMMPIGVQGTLISFAIKDGKYYLASKHITITAGLNETLSLVETTEAGIQAAIEGLDNY